MNGEELEALMMSMGSAENATYEGNLEKFGYADFEDPSGIDIYPLDFESKKKLPAFWTITTAAWRRRAERIR